MAKSLQELSDREAIRQTIYRHFRAADDRHSECHFDACWEDATFESAPSERSADAVPILYRDILPLYFNITNHHMTDLLIRIDGDRASTETYAFAYHIVPPNAEAVRTVIGPMRFAELSNDPGKRYEFAMGMRYCMRLERRDDIWKIAHIRIVNDWSSAKPFAGVDEDGAYSFLKRRGSSGRSDCLYNGVH